VGVFLFKVIKYLVTNIKKYYDRENFSLYVPSPDKLKPKIFATKTLGHKGFYFVILSSCLGASVAELKKFCHKMHKIQF
jgi:hypothetical protein